MAVDIAVPEVIAHEVGHALGFLTEDTNPTVMKPSKAPTVANSHDVSEEICRAVRFGPMNSVSSVPCCLRNP
jgi:hypothetical protein